jgi:serine O-acetyltransferase
MFANVVADLQQARKHNAGRDWFSSRIKLLFHPGTMAVVVYRFSRWAYLLKIPVLRTAFRLIAFFGRCFIEALTGVHISPGANIGPGLVVHTGYGVFVSSVRMGGNCVLNQGVLVSEGVRHIGDNVYFSAGAKVVANVTIGNNVMIAPNSLVAGNVPDNVTILGVPGRIIWKNDDRGATRLQRAQPASQKNDSVPVPGAGQLEREAAHAHD